MAYRSGARSADTAAADIASWEPEKGVLQAALTVLAVVYLAYLPTMNYSFYSSSVSVDVNLPEISTKPSSAALENAEKIAA